MNPRVTNCSSGWPRRSGIGGGDATLVRARKSKGLPNEKLIRAVQHRAERKSTRPPQVASAGLESSPAKRGARRQLATTSTASENSFARFDKPTSSTARGPRMWKCLFRKIEGTQPREASVSKVATQDYRGRTWVTRPRPEIDRVGSAWLIRKFIDPKAKFIFAKRVPANGRAVSFDMLDAEFSHHGRRLYV